MKFWSLKNFRRYRLAGSEEYNNSYKSNTPVPTHDIYLYENMYIYDEIKML